MSLINYWSSLVMWSSTQDQNMEVSWVGMDESYFTWMVVVLVWCSCNDFCCFTAVDDEPKMYDLLCMSYTDEDGKVKDFRLKERISRNWRDFAYALRFPIHVVESIKSGEDQAEHLLKKWLQGMNKTEDRRPITWGTLIAALHHTNFQEEVNILEKHLIQVDTVSTQSGKLSLCICSAWLIKFSSSVI